MDISMLYRASAETKNFMDEVVAQAQSGDKEAFGLIFEQHHRFIYKFIYAMLGDHALAEELTQDTFLGAYKILVHCEKNRLSKLGCVALPKIPFINRFVHGAKRASKVMKKSKRYIWLMTKTLRLMTVW